ncbi:ABC transporter permease [Thermococcus thermotolerans]|uniref:ABC transporter permease n=1 Tax=Thermococcus thermotolerans TaxID=2969672 RepID=UPI0021578B97|nr:ABC transporter permease [Thermococcus thermotolerans]
MMDGLRIVREFFRVQREVFFSYRWDVVSYLIGLLIQVAVMGIFASLVTIDANIEQYGTDSFLQFFLIGFIVHNIIFLPRGSLSKLLIGRSFPMLYASPAGMVAIFVGINAWNVVWSLMIMGLITVIFVLFYGLVIHINLGALLVILAGFTLTFALELFSAGFRAATKARQDPINWFLNLTSQLVSGLYFPPQVLPWWLQPISKIHPERYILEMARLTMGGGYSVSQIWPGFVNLALTTGVMLLVGIATFRWGVGKAMQLGTLGHV